MSDNNIYGADNIKVLEGLEAVRKRPSMYIGNTDVEGLHHLVYEIVDNSIDEAMAGYCDTIRVVIHADNSVSVEDNGRGIPVELHKQEGVPALEVVMTKLHAGGKFDNDSYKVSGGLHGVGVSVVNALSSVLEVEVFREGSVYYQRYEKGIKASELKVVGLTTKRGTKIHFVPDGEILTTTNFVFDILSRRCRELAFLNKGIRITIEDERTEAKNDFFYEGGISEFVQYLNRHNTPLHEPILIAGDRSDTQIEVAIQYNDTFTEKLFSFANNINTIEGGFHLIGFKAALTRTINQYATNGTLPKDFKSKISGEDVREGLTAVISVKIRSPQFEGQTKTKLGNSEVKGQVESLINEKLGIFFEENPVVLKKIIAKSAEAARARDAAKRARELVRSKGSLMDSTLPGKLADCQVSEPEAREIFIVEGDSAGGCFSGDTEVACTDGRNLSFTELIEEANQGKQNFCYTILPDGSIGIEKILHPRCTKKNAQVIKIVLDNDEEIVCTPDHLFMQRNGTYIQAKNLVKGDSLMPFYSEEFIKKENHVPYNHKIKRIEFLSETIDVYDIEVPNTHNFALASGVFVHNSAKQGRDRRFQAILPLKGKILNVEKARFDKILRSDEIRNIITALGTGVGDEEYDIEKIRYHKNIIMTDADVDGSHIRTLLLTFFYRHMPEVIERGYLYIAQPPLFKVTRGKNEMYLKHETDLSEYILKRVCDQKAIKNANGETISDHALYLFAGDLSEYLALTEKSEQRGIPASLIEFLIREGVENKQFLQNQEKMSGIKSLLIEKGYTIEEFSWSEEREIYRMRVLPPVADSSDKAEPVKIGRLIFSQEYQKCLDLAKRIFPFDYPPFAMFAKDKEGESSSAENRRALWNLLIEEGKKGVGVQRYKGLGEMNPDQLWDTTMNPETRTLLKVKIEDAVEADAIFSLLMGDVVEPRREFIQNNALEVSTLDI